MINSKELGNTLFSRQQVMDMLKEEGYSVVRDDVYWSNQNKITNPQKMNSRMVFYSQESVAADFEKQN